MIFIIEIIEILNFSYTLMKIRIHFFLFLISTFLNSVQLITSAQGNEVDYFDPTEEKKLRTGSEVHLCELINIVLAKKPLK